MSKNNQNEFGVGGNPQRKTSEFLPRFFRTTANNKFLQSTLDQLTQPGVVEKINGYFGRKTAKAFQNSDSYVADVSKSREDYQFEPAAVIKDDLDNVIFYKDYNDYLNQIKDFNGNTLNHSKLNNQETYAWNPNIDWDKFANFREYYWVPNGPLSVPVQGQGRDIVSTYTVELVEDDDNFAYIFSSTGNTRNPTLELYRGQTYRFEINTPGHPIAFAINRSWTPGAAVITATREGVRSLGLFDAQLYDESQYDVGDFIVLPASGGVEFLDDENLSQIYPDGIIKLGEQGEEVANIYIEKGTIEFTIPANAPEKLYYISKNSIDTSGELRIFDIAENTFIDVEKEILGKKTYKSSNGVEFTNGLKVYFQGKVTPEKYSSGQWYVEGVGDKIRLINESDLIISSSYTSELPIPFDSNPFDRLPFGDARTYAGEKDYIVVNRASQDRNAWSRYNRWFHKDVIEASSKYNNIPMVLDQGFRAKRPIIEFNPGIQLYNFGTEAKADIDLVDDSTQDVFSIIEGSIGYNVDGVDLASGMRVLFLADTDILVRNKIYQVNFIKVRNQTQISLLEVEDSEPLELETVLVKNGSRYAGKSLFYTNHEWKIGQEKLKVNQAPLFDLCCPDGNDYSDLNIFNSTTFQGTKIFSYKQGRGSNDTELGFPLSYKNIQNSGDIVFEFNLLTDSFTVQSDEGTDTIKTDTGFLRKYSSRTDFEWINSWYEIPYQSKQYVIRQYIADADLRFNFEVDVYDRAGDLDDLRIIVYVNNKLQAELVQYDIFRINGRAFVRFFEGLSEGNRVLIKSESKANKNNNGHYEFPYNLERNPLNEDITEFTFGEVSDHVSTIVEELVSFSGTYPGPSNLRDLGKISQFGKKFVKHSGPINLSLYHITSKVNNIIKAIRYSKSEYSKFKRIFIKTATDLSFDGSIKDHVDAILEEINKDKTKNLPFYFSDMIPVGPSQKVEYRVLDPRNEYYSLLNNFSLDQLSQKAVQVYLNGNLLLHGKDYTFDNNGFCLIKAGQQEDDLIEIYHWSSTDGSFVPPTPTKLGLYPSFEPQIYFDDTYRDPTNVIRGHDGSIARAFNDYRDDLILDLEKRIFNNIKQSYNPEIFDINNFKGGFFRDTDFLKEDIDSILSIDFTKWQQLVDSDYTNNEFYSNDDQFTFNYSGMVSPSEKKLPGFWRGVYQEAYDTNRPHLFPWEMLGFSVKPAWWNDVYGPAPYTRNNLILWKDLEEGVIREPNKPVIRKTKYARPGLLNHIPVDDSGKLLSPLASNFARNYIQSQTRKKFTFGDHSPIETAWRQSSEYPFSLLIAWILSQPSKVLGIGFDISRIKRNLANQYVYTETGKHITLKDLVLPNLYSDDQRVFTSGLVNYIFNLNVSDVTKIYDDYRYDLKNLRNQIGIKIAGFTDKSKFNLILDSKSPSDNKNGIFIPQENYQIFLNSSSPIKTPVYSGVTFEKTESGFILRGYSFDNPFFNYYEPISTSSDINIVVGGISEDFVIWKPESRYVKGQVIQESNKFYRATNSFTSGLSFDTENLVVLPELPIVGGRRARLTKVFNTRKVKRANFGSLFRTTQEVVDFLLGYGKYLEEQGFIFNYFNPETEIVENWDLSVREFLFWTTQNWSTGTVIGLSPSASLIEFKTSFSVVDNLFDNFYDYSILNSDARAITPDFTHTLRENNIFGLSPKNTDNGIYHLRLPLVQKEHVVLLDNITQFNDVIYERSTGYRQERIRVIGYRSDNWSGGLDIPGFIYDEARVVKWKEWKDYNIGTLVKYKEYYYVASQNIKGSSKFNSNEWYRLSEKPESKLLTNFDYRINQFSDFYDLDTDNFDIDQQKLAQHLIGYQKRDYLQNIINDDVSQYKFYQGFIQDKGTINALSKLFDALGAAEKESLEVYEEWGIQLGQYGASENQDFVEYKLDEKQFQISPQPIEVVNSLPLIVDDRVYRIQPFQTYNQSRDHGSTPFPVADSLNEYVRSAGYARADDVRYRVGNSNSLRSLNVNNLNFGDYIWVIDDLDYSWTVVQFVDLPLNVTNIEVDETLSTVENNSPNPYVRLTLDNYPSSNIQIGDNIAIIGADDYNASFFYTVVTIERNLVIVQTSTPAQVLDTEDNIVSFPLVSLRKVRAGSIKEANEIVQTLKTSGQRLWVDNYNGNWAVLENKPVYSDLQTVINPVTDDSSFHEFASVVSVSENNRDIIVGSPGYLDGRVHVYKRSNERNNSILQQTIVPPTDVVDSENNNYGFGKTVAISPDSEFLAVGMPDATNIKTRYKGKFDTASDYKKFDIVSYKESLWKTNRDIFKQIDLQEFTTFNSFPNLIANIENYDSTSVNLLITGDPEFENQTVDHFLVRTMLDQYLATEPGDRVSLKWNRYSQVHESNNEVLPWNNDTSLTYSDLTAIHTISEKVDQIIFVEIFTSIPSIGDIVTTNTASARVVYAKPINNDLVIYVNNQNGVFELSGDLFISDNNLVGSYTIKESVSFSDNLGGFWKFNVSAYDNGKTWYDQGKGLVYNDIILESETRSAFPYYNILDLVGFYGINQPQRLQASQIINLKYLDDPESVFPSEVNPEDLLGQNYKNSFLVRVPKNLSDTVTIGDTLKFQVYDFENYSVNVEPAGFTIEQLNKDQTVIDIWDGFIDFEYTEFDFSGNPYLFEIGDTVEDVQFPFDNFGGIALTPYSSTSSAEVVFVQKFFNSARIYLKNVSGNWNQLNNVATFKLKRVGNDTLRGPNDPDRISGTIADINQGISIGVTSFDSSVSIGKLLVFQSTSDLDLPDRAYPPNIQTSSASIVDEEYWLYSSKVSISDSSRSASIPSSLNKDYTQVYNVSVNEFGESQYYNEGVVALYRRITSDQYRYLYSIVSANRQNNKGFGNKLRFIQKDNDYTLFVSSKGDQTIGNNGTVEIIKHGVTNKDLGQYRGKFLSTRSYNKGEIVLYQGSYYRAIRNILVDGISINDTIFWENYSWRYGKDENYRGEFDNTVNYITDEIVSFSNRLYRAQTNVFQGSNTPDVETNLWLRVTDGIDYLGSLPNRSGTTFFEDEDFFDSSATNSFVEEYSINFGKDFASSKTGDVLIISSKQATDDNTENVVLVYRLIDNKYFYDQLIKSDTTNNGYAEKVAISPNGLTVAVGEPYSDFNKIDQGQVYIYTQIDGKFELTQVIKSPRNRESEKFGYNISLDDSQLVISAINGNITIPTIFDNESTTFDNNFTQFQNIQYDSGTVYMYEKVDNEFIFAEEFVYPATDLLYFGEYLKTNNNHIYVSAPRYRPNQLYQGILVDFRKNHNSKSWNIIRQPIPVVDISRIRNIYLYNTKTNNIVTYLDHVDTIQGKIPGPAEQELRYKLPYDPALYNQTPIVDLYSETNHWGEQQVGDLWWDISTSKFIHAYQGNTVFQANNFNLLVPGQSVDVYEWVESDLIPSEWDEIADTEKGLRKGVSGVSLYGDALYAQNTIYDNLSKTFQNRFYFWVKNKRTVPRIKERTVSCVNVARLIADPSGQGYRHVSFLSNSRLLVHNCNSFLNNDDIAIHINWQDGTNSKQNVHTQYQIMSEGLETSSLNQDIERKWFDSLIGYNENLKVVPDPRLPLKQRYGNKFKPRQGMFVNKTEALKQYIERVNSILREELIVDEYDISPLLQSQSLPSSFENSYDEVIDTDRELRFIGVSKVKPAVFKPIIRNGEITRVDIVDPGRGYKSPPTCKINGRGTNAEVETSINNLGQVTQVTVLNSGKNYNDLSEIIPRRFSVLVRSDSSAYSKWSIYSWNEVLQEWQRQRVQEFDVSLFWKYVDYYDSEFNQFTKVNYEIDQTYELYGLSDNIDDIVRVNNIGSGGWILLQKIDNQDTEDFSVNYKTVGRENGTIQFLSSLYDLLGNNIGYDSRSFDSFFYDSQPVKESRIILETIRDNLFVGKLSIEYNKLWFASLRYVFSEQNFVDWAFKTSFIKARHNVGLLRQDVTFNDDSLSSYESYVNEVKPYSTTVREFVSSYDSEDNTNSVLTDFDLAPAYNTVSKSIEPSKAKVKYNLVFDENLDTQNYPRKFWRDNLKYNVKEILIANPGNGYLYPPTVTIVGGGGTGATAKAFIGAGKITSIQVTDPGSGYISQPQVVIEGNQTNTGVPASASAVIGNGLVRSSKIHIKFDRIRGSYMFTALDQTETFTGTGNKLFYDLEWPIDFDISTIKVYVDNRELLRSEYTFENLSNKEKSYTRQQGRVTFTVPPALDTTIRVEYYKPLSMLDAADRIYHGYTAFEGMFGKDLSQLMDGIDYGGVEIRSFGFTQNQGWDSDAWYENPWDSYVNTFEDEIFTFDGSTISVKLSKPLENNTIYNVYLNGTRIDDPNFDSNNNQHTGPFINSIQGDGITDTIYLDELGIVVSDGDTLIIRKESSDGSFTPDPLSYDTQLIGGDLSYTNAQGINAEDIIVDGDGFVTPTTSKGPEELVPGQILDTLDLRVYTQDNNGQGVIYSQSYITDGITVEYDLGIIPNSDNAVVVKLDNQILDESSYTINWDSNIITLKSVPDTGKEFNIITVGETAQNVLDQGIIVTDGSTSDYSLSVKYTDNLSIFATTKGVRIDDIILLKDSLTDNVIVRLDQIYNKDIVIRYTLFNSNERINYSQISKDNFTGDGNSVIFELTNPPLYKGPVSYNTIVKIDNKILSPGYSKRFTIPSTNQREFSLDLFQLPQGSVNSQQVKVYLNNNELEMSVEWRFDTFNSSVVLFNNVGNSGDLLEVYVSNGDYSIVDNEIIFVDPPVINSIIEVFSFTNHDILGIKRVSYDVVARSTLIAGTSEYSTYHRLRFGEIVLNNPAVDTQYVWVIVNGELLTPSVDYYVTEDRQKVVLENKPSNNDVIDVIHFNSSKATKKFVFRQFKDILNRTHYKRIDEPTTELAQDLNSFDIRIEVVDASLLPVPNRSKNLPGILFINGERIEYFVKENNTLRHLRRGTLGTGIPHVHRVGEKVYDQGTDKNIPYKDETLTQIFTADGNTKTYPLDFIPSSVNEFDVFVAGRRLRKNEISFFKFEERDANGNITQRATALDSVEGDVLLPAEFSIDGETNILTLLNTPLEQTQVMVIRKIGKVWKNAGVELAKTDNDISRFLRLSK